MHKDNVSFFCMWEILLAECVNTHIDALCLTLCYLRVCLLPVGGRCHCCDWHWGEPSPVAPPAVNTPSSSWISFSGDWSRSLMLDSADYMLLLSCCMWICDEMFVEGFVWHVSASSVINLPSCCLGVLQVNVVGVEWNLHQFEDSATEPWESKARIWRHMVVVGWALLLH